MKLRSFGMTGDSSKSSMALGSMVIRSREANIARGKDMTDFLQACNLHPQ